MEPWLPLVVVVVVVVVAVERGCGWLLVPVADIAAAPWLWSVSLGGFVVVAAAVGGCGTWNMDCCMETIEVHTKGLMRAEWEAEREPVT